MIVRIDKSLQKDISKIQDKKVKSKLVQVIVNIQKANKLSEIRNIKKIKGSKNYYRIRVGEYRLGLIITSKQAELIRFIHRKDIHKYFP